MGHCDAGQKLPLVEWVRRFRVALSFTQRGRGEGGGTTLTSPPCGLVSLSLCIIDRDEPVTEAAETLQKALDAFVQGTGFYERCFVLHSKATDRCKHE